MSSCKKRIAPWIVKHLTSISDGLIENRFLFKKVARHIAEKTILQNQYPGECVERDEGEIKEEDGKEQEKHFRDLSDLLDELSWCRSHSVLIICMSTEGMLSLHSDLLKR